MKRASVSLISAYSLLSSTHPLHASSLEHLAPRPRPQETQPAPEDPYLGFKPETNPAKQPSTVYRGNAYEKDIHFDPIHATQFKDHQTPVRVPQITTPPPTIRVPSF